MKRHIYYYFAELVRSSIELLVKNMEQLSHLGYNCNRCHCWRTFGWISYYIYAALISWSGKWMNGKGNTQLILRILSYAHCFPFNPKLNYNFIPNLCNDIFKSEKFYDIRIS
jgi:hypothetical protein